MSKIGVILNITEDLWEQLNDPEIVGDLTPQEAIARYAELGVVLREYENVGAIIKNHVDENKVFTLNFKKLQAE